MRKSFNNQSRLSTEVIEEKSLSSFLDENSKMQVLKNVRIQIKERHLECIVNKIKS